MRDGTELRGVLGANRPVRAGPREPRNRRGRPGRDLPAEPAAVRHGLYGTLRAGGIIVPMNPQYKGSRDQPHARRQRGQSRRRAGRSRSERPRGPGRHRGRTGDQRGCGRRGATEFDDFLADETKGIVDRADDDIAVQPYTSGTTGTPKGVLLTHHNIGWTTRANADVPPGGFQASDRLVGTLPLFHIYGMSVVMNGAMYSGGTYYPVSEWDAPTVMDLLEDQNITIMFGVPAMFNDMINQPDAESYEFEALRFINSGGSGLPIEVLERFEGAVGRRALRGYGLTETSPVTHANRGTLAGRGVSAGRSRASRRRSSTRTSRRSRASRGADRRGGGRDPRYHGRARHPRPQRDERVLRTA